MAQFQHGRDVMGFEPKQKVYKLRFEDPDLQGLVVKVESAPVGAIMCATELAGLQDLDFSDRMSLSAEELTTLGKLIELFEMFADALIEWNLTKKGEPVPATLEGIKRQDTGLIMYIIHQWANASGGVSDPLEKPSTSGQQSAVAYLPMEKLSPNQAS